MKSLELYNHHLSKVNARYGAPMGRQSNPQGQIPAEGCIFDRQVPLDYGGYDRGGAYWGLGEPLRLAYSAEGDWKMFYRSPHKIDWRNQE